ncbi:MAG: hypothetical protein NC393_03310 [Clostridium sp.]|nr:hypothetical protein [Clostridium sp.]MCM1171136.1 hypothetical protein [Clostridium sp.]MCM1208954.1 hypothetical protein [Ruminococcus sp.]
MAKKKIPTVEELRAYIEKEKAYLKDCIENNKTYVITGPKFPGESIWNAKSTLPLLEAAETVGTSKEEIWELCSKIASATHAPVTKKEYERMIPFAEKSDTVNAVLQFLETNIPSYNDKSGSLEFDITAYYYCCALISLSDYRQGDCEKQLWNIVRYFIEKDEDRGRILLRNMKVLEHARPFLTPMKEMLEEAQNI